MKKPKKGFYSERDRPSDQWTTIPDIGTAWLVLSHGAWFGAEIAAASISLNESAGKKVGIVWASIAILICFWTAYAIYTTQKASKRLKSAIFGPEAFIMLHILNVLVIGASTWSLISIAIA